MTVKAWVITGGSDLNQTQEPLQLKQLPIPRLLRGYILRKNSLSWPPPFPSGRSALSFENANQAHSDLKNKHVTGAKVLSMEQ
jgi:hypothetical protein